MALEIGPQKVMILVGPKCILLGPPDSENFPIDQRQSSTQSITQSAGLSLINWKVVIGQIVCFPALRVLDCL